MTQSTNKRIVQPYLFFDGRCEEALEFYRKAIGAEVISLVRYKDSPDQAHTPPGAEDKILHATLRIGETSVLASDGECGGNPKFQGVSLALTAPDGADAELLFSALAEGGQVFLPLIETFFSPRFGMLADRFGVSWMIQAAAEGN